MDSVADSPNPSSPEPERGLPRRQWPDLTNAFKEIRQGNQEAFEGLLPQIHATAWPTICKTLRDPGCREEAIQDTDYKIFVYIMVTLEGPEPTHFEGLIHMIAKQRSVDILRHNRRWWVDQVPFDDIELGVAPAVGDPALRKRLQECMKRVPERQRQAVLEQSVGYSYSEIAELLDATETAVRNLIAHGRAALKNCMEELLRPRQGA